MHVNHYHHEKNNESNITSHFNDDIKTNNFKGKENLLIKMISSSSHVNNSGINSTKDIPEEIALYCIIKDNQQHLQKKHQIDIEVLLDGQKQLGRYMSLSFSSLLELLQRLENSGKIVLVNNFGNRYIQLDNMNTHEILENYYRETAR